MSCEVEAVVSRVVEAFNQRRSAWSGPSYKLADAKLNNALIDLAKAYARRDS